LSSVKREGQDISLYMQLWTASKPALVSSALSYFLQPYCRQFIDGVSL